jgi:hypothetical protein
MRCTSCIRSGRPLPLLQVKSTTSNRASHHSVGWNDELREVRTLLGLDDLAAIVEAAVPAHAMRQLDLVTLGARRLGRSLDGVRRTTRAGLHPAGLSLRDCHLALSSFRSARDRSPVRAMFAFTAAGRAGPAARAMMIPRPSGDVYPRQDGTTDPRSGVVRLVVHQGAERGERVVCVGSGGTVARTGVHVRAARGADSGTVLIVERSERSV